MTAPLCVEVILPARGEFGTDPIYGDAYVAERVQWRAIRGAGGVVVSVTAYAANHRNKSWYDERFFVAEGLDSSTPPAWVPRAPAWFWTAGVGQMVAAAHRDEARVGDARRSADMDVLDRAFGPLREDRVEQVDRAGLTHGSSPSVADPEAATSSGPAVTVGEPSDSSGSGSPSRPGLSSGLAPALAEVVLKLSEALLVQAEQLRVILEQLSVLIEKTDQPADVGVLALGDADKTSERVTHNLRECGRRLGRLLEQTGKQSAKLDEFVVVAHGDLDSSAGGTSEGTARPGLPVPGRAVQPTSPALSPGDLICEWYALCDRTADGVVDHPVLGLVPCCERCARDAGQQLLVLEGDVEARLLGERA